MVVRCMTCDHIINGDEKIVVGCLCDSDAPTWVGVDHDRRIISLSLSRFETITE